MDSLYLSGTDDSKFEYTILFTSNIISCYPADTATSIKQMENRMQVSFHPNPVEDEGLLEINSDGNTHATIDLLDQQGRKIETIYNGDLYAGSLKLNINTKALSSGIYLIALRSGEGSQMIKFIKDE